MKEIICKAKLSSVSRMLESVEILLDDCHKIATSSPEINASERENVAAARYQIKQAKKVVDYL